MVKTGTGSIFYTSEHIILSVVGVCFEVTFNMILSLCNLLARWESVYLNLDWSTQKD